MHILLIFRRIHSNRKQTIEAAASSRLCSTTRPTHRRALIKLTRRLRIFAAARAQRSSTLSIITWQRKRWRRPRPKPASSSGLQHHLKWALKWPRTSSFRPRRPDCTGSSKRSHRIRPLVDSMDELYFIIELFFSLLILTLQNLCKQSNNIHKMNEIKELN